MRMKVFCEMNEPCGEGARLIFRPVYTGSPENQNFFRYTPCGLLDVNIVNKPVAEKFKLGGEYFVDFVPANPPGAEAAPPEPAFKKMFAGGPNIPADSPVALATQAAQATATVVAHVEPDFQPCFSDPAKMALSPIFPAARQIADDPTIPRV